MKPLFNYFFIRADKSGEEKMTLSSGVEIYIDPDIRKYHHAVQCGIIEEVPRGVHAFDEDGKQVYDLSVQLKKGDKVYFHHFIVQDDNLVNNVFPGHDKLTTTESGEKLYLCHYRDIYAVVRKGKIILLEKWLLAQGVMEDESKYKKKIGDVELMLKPSAQEIPNMALVTHVSKECQEAGVEVGDKVFYLRDGNYDMTIEGEPYYRMGFSYLRGKVNGSGEIESIGDYVIVQEEDMTMMEIPVDLDAAVSGNTSGKMVAQVSEVTPSGLLIVNKGYSYDEDRKKWVFEESRQKEALAYSVPTKLQSLIPYMSRIIYYRGRETKLFYEGKTYVSFHKSEIIGVYVDGTLKLMAL